MFELMPWKKRGGKEISRIGSEPDSLYDRFGDHGSMIPAKFLREKALFPVFAISESKPKPKKLKFGKYVQFYPTGVIARINHRLEG